MATPTFECTVENPRCYRHCKGCGWNINEINRRKALLKSVGLKRDKNGLRRLILPKVVPR